MTILTFAGLHAPQWAVKTGRYLVYEDPLMKADAIVVLSGEFPYRVLEALDLYHAGWAPQIILTDATELPNLKRLYANRHGYGYLSYTRMGSLTRQGIPISAITVRSVPVSGTAVELKHVFDYAAGRAMTRVIVVTSNYHTRRVRTMLNALGPAHGIQAVVRKSRYSRFVDPRNWWRKPWSREFVISEYAKLAWFRLKTH